MNDARMQMALAHDPQFLNRVQFNLCVVALQIVNEPAGTTAHAQRRTYAAAVLGEPARAAVPAAVALVGAVNLMSETTSINPDLSVTTTASDAAIQSQLASLWNAFAGV
jgi:hypothetical protein